MDSQNSSLGEKQLTNDETIAAVWIASFAGFLLSSTTCAFTIYTISINKKLESIYFKVIRLAITYGFFYSLIWTLNLSIGYIVIDKIDIENLDIMCQILSPLKYYCLLQWLVWNGFILYLLHKGIKNTKFDLKKLKYLINRILHPGIILISLIIAFLPFYNLQSYTTRTNSEYYKYICTFHSQRTNVTSQILFFILNLLPMWLIVIYTFYIYVDVYISFRKLKLTMPENYWRMMQQPLIITMTWIWPTIQFILEISGLNSPFLMKAMFMVYFFLQIEVTQGFSVFFQCMIYLNQIKKFLHLNSNQGSKDQVNDSKNQLLVSLPQQVDDTFSENENEYSLQNTQYDLSI